MIGTLVGLLLMVLFLGVLWYLVQRVIAVIPNAEPFATIAICILILIGALIALGFLVELLQLFGVAVHLPFDIGLPRVR